MNTSSETSPEGIPAATVVIFRNGPEGRPPEILMTIRSREMVFAGGMAVFPGGRVDPADFELGAAIGGPLDPDEAAHQIAVVRETLEETGLAIGLTGEIDADRARAARDFLQQTGELAPVLEHFGWELDLAQLTPFARWYPKNERIPRVYDTRFYLADLGTGSVDIAADLSENTHLFWTSAQDALDAAERGEIKVIFPTRRNLERLALFSSFAEAKAQAEAIPVRTITPYMDEKGGKTWLSIGEDHGYPVAGEPLDEAMRG
ncbi:NUDIX domain-containing protein [Altererythrobacter xiamenensis]|uniref:NUDIX domain-containing protein n=1 Tax=Altererythrobacter xiamenensis TaxID=1316679 RepID=A0A1Y6F5Y4_9SPHN|nr:NUDIX domain-containing protein [Altererythrobacter xiamenensis]SMQ69866.1 NUDIX domain-containing protein [Altererythrobacter xiamenensis]